MLVLLTFGGTLRNRFVFDDHRIVGSNPVIRTLDPASHFGSPFWAREGRSAAAYDYYRPAVSLALALEWKLFGDRPWGYHLVNLLLHSLNAFFLFLLVREVAGAGPAAVSAALFAVHPVQTEAVAAVVGLTDLLATGPLLLAAWIHARFPDRPARSGLPVFAAGLAALALGLLSKESAVVFPALVLGVELAGVLRGSRDRAAAIRRLRATLPAYIALIGLYVLLRYAIVGQLVGDPQAMHESWRNPLIDASLVQRLLTAVHIAGRYLWLLVFPAALSIDYGLDAVPLVRSALSPAFLAPLAALAACAALVWRGRRNPLVAFGATVATGTYALVSHVPFPGPVVMAERVLYLSMSGLVPLGVVALWSLVDRLTAGTGASRPAGRIVVGLAVVLVLAAAVRSFVRVGDWRDDLTLYHAAAAATPRSVLVWNNLGSQQLRAGQVDESLASFDRALAIHPAYVLARLNRSAALRAAGRLSEAEAVLRKLVREHPESGQVWLALVPLLVERAGQLEAIGPPGAEAAMRAEAVRLAREQARKAAAEGSHVAASTLRLAAARALHEAGRPAEAEQEYAEALDAAERAATAGLEVPEAAHRVRAAVLGSHGAFLAAEGRSQEAARRYLEAVDVAERAGDGGLAARLSLDGGRAFVAAGRPDAALDAYRRAERLAGDDDELRERARTAAARVLAASEGAGAVLAAGDGKELTHGELLAAAESELQAGAAEEALSLYARALAADPSSARARHGRARARLLAGDLAGAEDDLRVLLDAGASGRRAAAIRTDLATIAARQGDAAGTLEHLDRAVEADPGFALARYHRGMIRLNGDPAGSERDLLAALGAGLPGEAAAESWFRLAGLAVLRDELDTARKRIDRCLTLHPDHEPARALQQRLNN